jgi:hypothetical protein
MYSCRSCRGPKRARIYPWSWCLLLSKQWSCRNTSAIDIEAPFRQDVEPLFIARHGTLNFHWSTLLGLGEQTDIQQVEDVFDNRQDIHFTDGRFDTAQASQTIWGSWRRDRLSDLICSWKRSMAGWGARELARIPKAKIHEDRQSNVDKCSLGFVACISYRVSCSNLHSVSDESSFKRDAIAVPIHNAVPCSWSRSSSLNQGYHPSIAIFTSSPHS